MRRYGDVQCTVTVDLHGGGGGGADERASLAGRDKWRLETQLFVHFFV